MLRELQISNYRCLREVKVPLRPLTVFLGPNDSGKTAALRALEYLAGARNLERFDWWRGKQEEELSVTGRAPGFEARRSPIHGDVLIPHGSTLIHPTQLFQLPSGGVSMTSAGHADEGEPPAIGAGGEGIPALLDHLLRRDRKRFFAVVEVLRDLVEGLEDIEIATPSPANRRIDLILENGFRMPADRASVGVRLLLFFVAMAYHPKPPKLMLIEEPENSVHPKRLRDVVRLLREITEGKHGNHAAQVVLTTHSPHLLDYFDLDKDQVLVFSRAEDGSRNAEPADAERLKNFLDEFMLGEVWYNEGEAGLVRRDK